MTEWFVIITKAIWCGFAGLGFGVLFNVPVRALLPVWVGGFIAGLVKFSILHIATGAGMTAASFAAALTVGFLSLLIAYLLRVPPLIFAIPSVIPLIPGAFAYRTMLGLMKLTGNIGSDYTLLLSETVYNGVTTLFVIMALSLGVTVPLHIMRWDSIDKIRLRMGDRSEHNDMKI